MTSQPNQPGSDETDPEKETTPAGVTRDLEEMAEEVGASTGPFRDPGADPDSPGRHDRRSQGGGAERTWMTAGG